MISKPGCGTNPQCSDDQQLLNHSFDAVHFPMYLSQRVPSVVRPEAVGDSGSADLIGYFLGPGNVQLYRYLSLRADEHGVSTKTDDFFFTIHSSFRGLCPVNASYVGFARCGPPVYAPLFALAALYREYGRGLYMSGETLPTRSSIY